MGVHRDMKERILAHYKARNKKLEEENASLREQILQIHLNQGKPLRDTQRKEILSSFDAREARLLKEIERLNRVVETQNKRLDIQHYVWCSGCTNGMHRFSEKDMYDEKLMKAIVELGRARTWYFNYKYRTMDEASFQAWKKHFLDKVKWYVD